MVKRVGIGLLIMAGIVLLAGSILYLYRIPLAESLIQQQLHKQGIPVQSLRVSEVTLDSITLRDLSLGEKGEISVSQIIAQWDMERLLNGELISVELDGALLSLDLRSNGELLGSLHDLRATNGTSQDSFNLPHVLLQGASIDLHTDHGDFNIVLNGSLKPQPDGATDVNLIFSLNGEPIQTQGKLNTRLAKDGSARGKLTLTQGAINRAETKIAELSGSASFAGSFTPQRRSLQHLNADVFFSHINLSDSRIPGMAFELARLSLEINDSTAVLGGTLRASNEELSAHIDLTARNYLDEPDIDMELSARGTVKSRIWEQLGVPQPTSGSVFLSMTTSGQTPPLSELRDAFQAWLQSSRLTGSGQLALQDVQYPGKISGLNGHLAFSAEGAQGTTRITLADTSLISATRIEPAWLEDFGLPPETAAQLSSGGSLSIGTTGGQPSRIVLHNRANRMDLAATGSASLITEDMQAIVSARAEGVLDARNSLGAFKVDNITARATGLHIAGITLDRALLSGDIRGLLPSWTGNLDLAAEASHLTLGPLAGDGAVAALPMHIGYDRGRWQMKLRRTGQLRLEHPAPISDIQITGPLAATLTQADIVLTPQTNGTGLTHDITLSPADLTLHLAREGQTPLQTLLQSANIKLTGRLAAGDKYRGQGDIELGSISLPGQDLQLENLSLQLDLQPDATGRIANFTIGNIRHNATVPYFAPHTLSGNLLREAETYALVAIAGMAGTDTARLHAEHAPASGKGTASISLIPLRFTPGGLQPRALAPGLALLADVSGTADGNAQFQWTPDGFIQSTATLVLKDASFSYQDIGISGLNGALMINDLLSSDRLPSSPPGQQISVQSIDPGLSLDNLNLRYRLQATDPPSIAVEDATLAMIGGRLSFTPTVIDPASLQADTIMRVEGLDLATLFELIKVTGLSGSGKLSGSIPISLDGRRIAIRQGQLVAKAPGILRFQSERATQLLSGAGEEMNLLLQALQEFHYTELSLKLDKTLQDDLVATLSLLGSNPNVSKGRPFRLNINLESNIGQILDSIAQGYIISNEALRNVFRLR